MTVINDCRLIVELDQPYCPIKVGNRVVKSDTTTLPAPWSLLQACNIYLSLVTTTLRTKANAARVLPHHGETENIKYTGPVLADCMIDTHHLNILERCVETCLRIWVRHHHVSNSPTLLLCTRTKHLDDLLLKPHTWMSVTRKIKKMKEHLSTKGARLVFPKYFGHYGSFFSLILVSHVKLTSPSTPEQMQFCPMPCSCWWQEAGPWWFVWAVIVYVHDCSIPF